MEEFGRDSSLYRHYLAKIAYCQQVSTEKCHGLDGSSRTLTDCLENV